MPSLLLRRALPAAAAAFFIYFFGLSRVGLLGPDEPRYAAIGREMAFTGGFVTPRLWGEPWFEKPALLYWMTAAGFRAGLGDELAPRLPVAIVSVAFLVYFFVRLRRWLDDERAWAAVLILGTSGGWVAISQVGITDLPLAAAFGAAMLCGLELLDRGKPLVRRAAFVGALLGIAMLAKGLVPLVLALPFFIWVAWRRRWIELGAIGTVAVAVAAPWYVACYARNGWPFIEEFFLKHHFGRFSDTALQHVQPWWFYVPVILGFLFPWTPLIVQLPKATRDVKVRFFAVWFAWGFLFFSASTNKLPAYVLPLLPAAAVLLASVTWNRIALAVSALSFALLPVVADVLPTAIASGLSRSAWAGGFPLWAIGFVAALVMLVWVTRREHAIWAVAGAMCFGVCYLKLAMYPKLDQVASARPLWRKLAPYRDQVCVDSIHRAWLYGLNYYFVAPLPACDNRSYPLRLVPGEGDRPVVASPVEARR